MRIVLGLDITTATRTNKVLSNLIHRLLVRHSAVHRLQTEMTGLKLMIEDAVSLASVLKDDLRRNKLRSIEIELHGGDVEKLEEAIQKPLEAFSTFAYPGRLPLPPA